MPGVWTYGIDYQNQPLLDAWWTPGWTSQNIRAASVQVPANQFSAAGFPSGLAYVNVAGNYFDTGADPLSGYLTFWPSTPLTFTVGTTTTYMPQRYAGASQSMLGFNQMGSGKIYLWQGQLSVSLLATDQAVSTNMTPNSFSYHVKEHYFLGNQYDILVPSINAPLAPTDIHNLIIPGSIRPIVGADEWQEGWGDEFFASIPVTSSQFLAADISTMTGGMGFNPTSFPVNFAFIAGTAQPTSTQWHAGSWSSANLPYVAQIMLGPNGFPLTAGTYQIWVQVVATPQVPVMPVGFVTIY